MRRPFRRFGVFLAEVALAQQRDQLLLHSAALAYTTLLSLVPLMTVALATIAPLQPDRAELVVRAIATVIPFSPARVQGTLTMFAERTISMGWLAVVGSGAVAIYAFYQIEEVINTIWGVPHRRSWQWRLASFTAVLIWGPLLLTTLFSALYWVSSRPWYRLIAPLARPLPAVFAVATLTAVYRWVPHTRVRWSAALTGGVVASVVLVVLHIGFQTYLDIASDLNVIYGSLTLVIFFLISLYLFWTAILLGAEASWVAATMAAPPTVPPAEAVLRVLVEAQRNGTISDERVRAVLGAGSENALALLSAPPKILAPSPGGWRLARKAEAIPLAEVRARTEDAPDRPDEGHTLATYAKLFRPGSRRGQTTPGKPAVDAESAPPAEKENSEKP